MSEKSCTSCPNWEEGGEVIWTKFKRTAAFFWDVFPYNKECKEEAALEEQPQLSISQPNASSSQKRKTRKPEEPETKDQRQKGT